jgi:lipopolysaccharide/colanic/teichoic acid biosynthesis glycosyltransferase/UDP-glucose 6-dehydrogenase
VGQSPGVVPGVLVEVNGHQEHADQASFAEHPPATVAVVGKGAAALEAVDHFYRQGHNAMLATPHQVSPAEGSQNGAAESVIRGVNHELMVAQAAGRPSYVWICTHTILEQFVPDHIHDLEKLAASLRGAMLVSPVTVVLASLLPVGTGDWLQRLLGDGFHVVACPPLEHATEVNGWPQPRLVLGADDPAIAKRVKGLLGTRADDAVVTGRREAEMIGYAVSSISALRHSAAEELAAIARDVGVDVQTVLTAVGMDRRAGVRSDKRGGAFGAHLGTLLAVAASGRLETPVLSAARRYQPRGQALLSRVLSIVGAPDGKSIGFWGLGLKGDADQRDGSAVLYAARMLAASGARVTIWEPAVRDWSVKDIDKVHVVADREEAAAGAQVLVIGHSLANSAQDLGLARRLMDGLDVVDAAGELDAAPFAAAGLTLHLAAHSHAESNGHAQRKGESNGHPLPVGNNHSNGSAPPLSPTHDLITGRALLAGIPESAVEAAGPRRRPARGRRLYEVVKRSLDVLAGGCALVVGAPVFIGVALAILLDDGRPIFFRADRVGLRGRIFPMYKFRSMRPEAPRFANKTTVGTYVTRTGAWLRRFGLDELPQAWHLVRGDMTLVGPRPEQPHIVDWYQPWQSERLNVKPGITGWWQVRMRGTSAEMYRNVELDIWYVRNRSLGLDIEILLRTPGALVKGGRA